MTWLSLPADRGAADDRPVVEVEGVSKWFGGVVAVSDVSFTIPASGSPRSSGRTGPASRRCSGCSAGCAGRRRARCACSAATRARTSTLTGAIGLAPQQESVFEPLTASTFVACAGRAARVPDPAEAAAEALRRVELDPDDTRRLPTYSKGMRQRVKLAQAIVHDPPVIVLDEPLTGLDPRQRSHMVGLFHRLGAEGRCVIVIEPCARGGRAVRVERARHVQGPLAASGDFHEIRALMDDRPLRLRVRTDAARALGGALLGAGVAMGIRLEDDGSLLVDTQDARRLAHELPVIARAESARLLEVRSLDSDLEGVFRYLVER